MTLRRSLPLAFICSFVAIAAARADERYVTENFVVHAPTKPLAKTFGEYAEKYREEKARDWLGKEMPRWSQKCPLVIEITEGRTGGATTFTFSDRAQGVLSQEMKIFGSVKQLLESVLPHEITHTVLAHHFGQAVPRWADEGGSVLSENDKERLDHDVKCREFLNAGRGIPLRILFAMKEYPRDMIVLYAQGYSVSDYLITLGGGGLKGRKRFLDFLETGMQKGNKNWEKAVASHYEFDTVDNLQVKWIDSLRKPPADLASRAKTSGGASVASLSKNNGGESRGYDLRTSAGPGLPQLEPPILGTARSSTPREDDDRPAPTKGKPTARPTYSSPMPPNMLLLPPDLPSSK